MSIPRIHLLRILIVLGFSFTLTAQYENGALAYALANGQLWISDPFGGNKRLLSTGLNAGYPKIRNGMVYFISYQFPFRLFRINPLDPVPTPVEITTVASPGLGIVEFDVNPAGTHIVMTYIESAGGGVMNSKIYWQDLSNAATRIVLVDSPNHQLYPFWGADGNIYFGQSNVGSAFSQHIFRVPASGGTPVALTTAFNQYPAFVPVANKVAFINTTSYTLSLMNPDGTGQAAVPGGHNGITNALDGSSDGSTLFFFIGSTLYRVPLTGGARTVVDAAAAGGNGVSFGRLAGIPGDAYQLRYVSNLDLGDAVINLSNSGARGAGLAAGTSASTTGALCANVYAFSPDEQMVACCSCPVTPNGLVSLSARADLLSNTFTPAVPTSMVVKLLASVPDAVSGCTNSASQVNATNLAPGLVAWGTTTKQAPPGGSPSLVETRFAIATLSTAGTGSNVGELGRLQQLCTFIQANGSGFGICRSCALGGLGSSRL